MSQAEGGAWSPKPVFGWKVREGIDRCREDGFQGLGVAFYHDQGKGPGYGVPNSHLGAGLNARSLSRRGGRGGRVLNSVIQSAAQN